MKWYFYGIFAFIAVLTEISCKELKRMKRDLFQMEDMLFKCTNPKCDPVAYLGYGCYCGLGGNGTPLDEIDKCCQNHDHCYTNTKCGDVEMYTETYEYDCENKVPVCRPENSTAAETCGEKLCECDRDFSLCLLDFACPTSKLKCDERTKTFLF